MTQELDLSITIITRNEEKRIETCLQSLPQGSEVIILDSESEDSTVELARRHGARVESKKFTNYAEQKNAALAFATRGWILSVDADEVLDDKLRAAIVDAVKSNKSSGYSIKRQLVFMGKEMRFGKTTDYPLRLFKREEGSFESAIHEKVQLKGGEVLALSGVMKHYSYDSISDYFTRFDSYTTKIAQNHYNNGKKPPSPIIHGLRPFAEFIFRYFFRLGFLDGYPGFVYAIFSSLYVFTKYAKLRELREMSKLKGR